MRHIGEKWPYYALTALSFLPAGVIYYKIVGAYVTLFLAFLLVTYSFFMGLSQKAQNELLQLETFYRLDEKKGFRLSLVISLPIYWNWLIISLIPITSFYAWMITGFPINVHGFIHLKVIEEHVKRKALFWCVQVVIYVTILSAAQFLIGFII